jgi:hypothetical protein
VYDNRTRDEISQPSALLVAHHADQTHSINARQPIYCAHQVPSKDWQPIGRRSSRLLSSLAKERLGTEPCMFYESYVTLLMVERNPGL